MECMQLTRASSAAPVQADRMQGQEAVSCALKANVRCVAQERAVRMLPVPVDFLRLASGAAAVLLHAIT